jgi:hypothetical protein
MRTNTLDGPPCVRKWTRQYRISPIFSVPCPPNWISKTLSDIWCSNTTDIYIDTSKQKWIFWTSPHWVWLTDMMSRSSKNLSRRGESLDLQNPHNRRREKVAPTHTTRDREKMATLRKNSPRCNTRRAMRRQRRTQENSVNTIKSLGTTRKNVAPRIHSWLSWRVMSQMSILNLNQIQKEGSGLSILNPVPLTTKFQPSETRRTIGRKMPLSLTDVGKGGSASFHYQ